jgi:hypothetical protein
MQNLPSSQRVSVDSQRWDLDIEISVQPLFSRAQTQQARERNNGDENFLRQETAELAQLGQERTARLITEHQREEEIRNNSVYNALDTLRTIQDGFFYTLVRCTTTAINRIGFKGFIASSLISTASSAMYYGNYCTEHFPAPLKDGINATATNESFDFLKKEMDNKRSDCIKSNAPQIYLIPIAHLSFLAFAVTAKRYSNFYARRENREMEQEDLAIRSIEAQSTLPTQIQRQRGTVVFESMRLDGLDNQASSSSRQI